jgi:hypothetical protein
MFLTLADMWDANASKEDDDSVGSFQLWPHDHPRDILVATLEASGPLAAETAAMEEDEASVNPPAAGDEEITEAARPPAAGEEEITEISEAMPPFTTPPSNSGGSRERAVATAACAASSSKKKKKKKAASQCRKGARAKVKRSPLFHIHQHDDQSEKL